MPASNRRAFIQTGALSWLAWRSPSALAQIEEDKTMLEGPDVTPFLMFEGKAEEAMNCYVGLFENSKIVNVSRYGPGEQGPEGSVQHAVFTLNGQKLMCIDSPAKHPFSFTPSISLFVSDPDEEKITHYFNTLSEGGQVMMPLDKYPFSKRFAWLQDKFGVSWQLSAS